MNYNEKLKDLKRNEMPPLYEALIRAKHSKNNDSCRAMLSKFRHGKLAGGKQAEFEKIIDKAHKERVICRSIDGMDFDSKGVIVGYEKHKITYILYTTLGKLSIDLDPKKNTLFLDDIKYLIAHSKELVLKLDDENRDELKLLIAKIILDERTINNI